MPITGLFMSLGETYRGKEKMEITNRVNHAYKKNSYLEVRGDKEKENIVWRENI